MLQILKKTDKENFMKDLIISLESTCDLTPELLKKYELSQIDMSFFVDGNEYTTETDSVVSSGLYEKMKSGKKTSTSQINSETYAEFFEKLLAQNKPILHIAFSSGLSGTYHAACQAAELLNKTHENKIVVVDSLCACGGHGLLAILTREFSKSSKSIDEVVSFVEDLKTKLNHTFTVDNLKYLANGGRLKASSAFVGNLLNIKPVLKVDENGKLVVTQKTIGRKCAINQMFNIYKKNRAENSDICIISHANCLNDANTLASMIKKEYGITPIITDLGPIIGCHSGPGTLAHFYVGKTK